MSLTNTNREVQRQGRAGGLRDLRFAGTVAAGLVAGVLGVGALTAPLLGWTEWPSSPATSDHGGTVTLRDKATTTTVARRENSGGSAASRATTPVLLASVGVPG